MSINSVTNNSLSMPASRADQSFGASDAKKLEEILSNYDSKSMDETSISKLKSELQSSGIKPGKGMGDMLVAAGFDPAELRPEGNERSGGGRGPEGTGKRPPPPPKEGNDGNSNQGISADQLNLNILESLSSTLQNFDLNNLSEADQLELVEQLRSQGILQSGLMIDLSA